MPKPTFHPEEIAAFRFLSKTEHKENAVVATWWDYGYASMFFNVISTLHDGGSQTTPTTHFVARALTTANANTSVGIFKFLTNEGHSGIRTAKSVEELEAFIEANRWS